MVSHLVLLLGIRHCQVFEWSHTWSCCSGSGTARCLKGPAPYSVPSDSFRTLVFSSGAPSPVPAQVDRLEDELMGEQEKLKGITEELEQTFAEMSGY